MNQEMEKKLKDILAEFIEAEQHEKIYALEEEDELSNVGFNSITFVKIAIKIEETFDITIDDDDLSYLRFPTLKSLSDYIDKKKN